MGIVVQGAGQENEAQKNRDTRDARAAAAKRLAEKKAAEAAEAARRAEEERRAKAKKRAELEAEITEINDKIKELQERKLQYNNMKGKIEEAQSALESANSKISEAQDTLSIALTGNQGDTASANLTSETTEVNTNINDLETIAGAIEPHMKEIREEIQELDLRRTALRLEIDKLW